MCLPLNLTINLSFFHNILVFTDRCRQGVYDFSNQDYFTRKKCWFPPAYKDGDYFEVTDEIFIEPEDKRAFEAYAIPLTGGGKKRKRKESATVTISLFVAEFLAKCRDLKDLVFGKLSELDYINSSPLHIIFEYFRPRRHVLLQV